MRGIPRQRRHQGPSTTRRRPGSRRSPRTPAWRWMPWREGPGSAPPAGWDGTPPTRRRTATCSNCWPRIQPGEGAPGYRSAVAGRRGRPHRLSVHRDGGGNDCDRPPRQRRLWLRPGVPGSGIRQDHGGTEPRGERAHQSPRPGASAGGPFPEGGPRCAGTYNPLASRGVAQSGSAPALGAGSRRFKSSRPDNRRGRAGASRPRGRGPITKRGSASSSVGQSGGLLSRGVGGSNPPWRASQPPLLISVVDVAQWQSTGLWFRWLGVRVPSSTPSSAPGGGAQQATCVTPAARVAAPPLLKRPVLRTAIGTPLRASGARRRDSDWSLLFVKGGVPPFTLSPDQEGSEPWVRRHQCFPARRSATPSGIGTPLRAGVRCGEIPIGRCLLVKGGVPRFTLSPRSGRQRTLGSPPSVFSCSSLSDSELPCALARAAARFRLVVTFL